MCPKWFNIKRGMILCMILGGWALCPWIIIESGETFLSFMGAYAIFMAPFAGILCCDYWIVKRRKYDVPALYDPRGIYYYKVCSRLLSVSQKIMIANSVGLFSAWHKLACFGVQFIGYCAPSPRIGTLGDTL